MRLESQLKNTSDAFKMDATSWAEPFIDALADSLEESAHFKDLLSTINEELYNQYIATGRITPEMRNVVAEYDRAKEYGETWGKLLEGEVNPATEDATEDTKALAAAQEQAADAIKKATDANKSYVSNLEKVAGITQNYKDGLADAQKELDEGRITTKEYEDRVRELGDAYTDAKNQIVLSLLEMKLTADGVFTDEEMQVYIGAMEKLGVITAEDKDVLNALLGEAQGLQKEFTQKTVPSINKVRDALYELPPPGTVFNYTAVMNTSGQWNLVHDTITWGGGGLCFIPGTPVTMADGSIGPIESLNVGDRVMSYDTRTGRTLSASIRKMFRHTAAELRAGYYMIINYSIGVTAEHNMYIKDEAARTS